MKKRIFQIMIIAVTLSLFQGCYTQFVSRDLAINENVSKIVDSSGDTIMVVNRIDTVFEKEHEVCVWERDIMGYPRLRCYKSYYPRDWFIYSNTPWWYRNDPFWGDYDRCPRYYYYDYDCGCCRFSSRRSDYYGGGPGPGPYHDRDHYYDNHSGGGGGGGGGVIHSGSSGVTRSSGQSVQSQGTRTSGKKVAPPARTTVPSNSVQKESPGNNNMNMQQPSNAFDSSAVRNREHRSMRGR